jgi:hypothetical protein
MVCALSKKEPCLRENRQSLNKVESAISIIRNILVWYLLLAVPLIAQNQDGRRKPPALASPAEVKKTVDAIVGSWSGEMTARVPGAPVESFNWKMDCKAIAVGAGASCTNSGKASIGFMAESCLLAFDPESKSVHYMCVTSMGEVHDHKGTWKDAQTIEFEPLKAGMMGQLVTETNRWYFPDPNTIDKTSEVALADGSSMSFEFKGKRTRSVLLKVN